MHMNRPAIAVSLAAGALALTACGTNPKPPVAEMAEARTLVSEARPEAVRYAPEPLRQAQAKLARAEEAMAREAYVEARRLAEQAAVDARLAASMAQSERAQMAANEVNASLRTLQQQLERRTQ